MQHVFMLLLHLWVTLGKILQHLLLLHKKTLLLEIILNAMQRFLLSLLVLAERILTYKKATGMTYLQ